MTRGDRGRRHKHRPLQFPRAFYGTLLTSVKGVLRGGEVSLEKLHVPLGVVTNTYNLISWEMEAGGSGVQGQL